MMVPILPMLAVPGEPFDSDEHLFEVKWDGVRALASVEGGGWQLWGRERSDYGPRYPELEVLRRMPSGTVVDGELIVLREGRSSLEAILPRHQLVGLTKIRLASRQAPVHYVLFDLLFHRGRSMLDQPLVKRRAELEELLGMLREPRFVFSEGIRGAGRKFFEEAVGRDQEGIMAKRLASPYLPGQRASAWQKIKSRREISCLILGYTASHQGLGSLLVAAPWQDKLQYVAQLSCGFSQDVREHLLSLLATRTRGRPIVPCPKKAVWVEPALYCQVRFLEWTSAGRLRGASFLRLITETA